MAIAKINRNIISSSSSPLKILTLRYNSNCELLNAETIIRFAQLDINRFRYSLDNKKVCRTDWPKDSSKLYVLFYEKQTMNQSSLTAPPFGFENLSKSCFANAALQCLLLNQSINAQILAVEESSLKNITRKYNDRVDKVLNSDEIIRFLKFDLGVQHDAYIFLQRRFHRFKYLNSEIEFTKTYAKRCCNEICNFTYAKDYADLTLPITIPCSMAGRVVDIYEILEISSEWEALSNLKCPLCGLKGIEASHLINSSSNTLILVLVTFFSVYSTTQKYNLKIKDLPNSELKVGNSKYVLKSAIFHNCSTVNDGHYFSKCKINNDWFNLYDTSIAKCKWPNNSENVYVLFYEKKNRF